MLVAKTYLVQSLTINSKQSDAFDAYSISAPVQEVHRQLRGSDFLCYKYDVESQWKNVKFDPRPCQNA